MMNNQEIKDKILQDIAAAKEQGFTIITDDWGERDMRCACPLGCVNLALGVDPAKKEEGGVMTVLGVNSEWITSFIDGYDQNGQEKGALVPEAWQMGAEIREQIKHINYYEYQVPMDEDGD